MTPITSVKQTGLHLLVTIYKMRKKKLQQNTQIKSLPIKSLQLCLHLYPTHYTNYKKLITLNDRVPCAGAQCCVITTLTTSDTERYTQIQLHKKEFRVPVRNVVHSQHWPPLTRRKCKNVTQYSDSLLLKIFTSGTSYSEIISLSDINSLIPGYTRHKGRVGSAPS